MPHRNVSVQAAGRMVEIIDLNDLRIFAYVASLASFSLAADELQIHKSSVSRSIARLETMLATSLVQRTTRKVLLTKRGLELRDRCVDLLSHVSATIGAIGAGGHGDVGVRGDADRRPVVRSAQSWT